ncbi:protein-disulfide reductase DsbD domain-containing protein [Microvirga solisilvae]|uniref:protein-disulfide reductase DsbD domain-containing protein n=1 Tax=Microvirga solisilvae TaxID=2919498 RepID=UPI001FAFB5E1|nr:protein-disulfide reductase DsbD domain-containing protein [Microvirga solisilvae]
MTMTFRIAASAVFLILSLFPGFAQPSPSSTSAQGFHSKVRLLSGGRQGGNWLAGIEIALDPGFKTYWRNPGESGLPPSFDWSRSENVADVEVRWPAPKRHEDAAGVAYVYEQKAVLPVVVKPVEAGKPVKLALTIDYGICKDICIPAHAELNLPLSDGTSDRAAIEQAMPKVPRKQALGEQADLSVLSAVSAAAGERHFVITVRAPAGTSPVLFTEGPENWYFSTSKVGPESSAVSTTRFFNVKVEEKPKDAAGPVPLTLTLVAGDKAVETQVSLDGNGLPR